MLDLCRFKEVNDTLGHDVGDEVLREVSNRFAAKLAGGAFISRIGGDEFTVVLANIGQRRSLTRCRRHLMDSLKTPIDARGIAIEVGVSIGIAVFPDHRATPKSCCATPTSRCTSRNATAAHSTTTSASTTSTRSGD